jgi:hypothetical protein
MVQEPQYAEAFIRVRHSFLVPIDREGNAAYLHGNSSHTSPNGSEYEHAAQPATFCGSRDTKPNYSTQTAELSI